MKRLWTEPSIRLIPPYSSVDLSTGQLLQTDAEEWIDARARSRPECMEDWDARLSPEEWDEVERFARQFQTLKHWQDFIAFTVGGETKTFHLRPAAANKPQNRRTGVNFCGASSVPA